MMGIAILWIMFFHSYLDVRFFPFFDMVKNTGNAGVEIFMFVSGFGIYYSLSKNLPLKVYYKNRILRILPYYLPIVLIYSLYLYAQGVWNAEIIIKNLLMINYWSGPGFDKIFDWYIPSIFLLYLLAPLFYHFFKKNKVVASLSVIIFFYCLSLILMQSKYAYLELIVMRVPVFIAGFWLADYTKKNKDAKLGKLGITLTAIALFVGFGSLFVISTYFFHMYQRCCMYGFAIATFPLCMFFCYLFSKLPSFKFSFLHFCGTYSLTLFIFHERVRDILVLNGVTEYMDFIAFALTFLLAVSWTKLVDYVLDKILPKFAPSY